MIRIQGKVRSVKATANQTSVTRQLVIEFAENHVIDEITEMIRANEMLDITLTAKQTALKIGHD